MAKGFQDERYRRIVEQLVARRKELRLTQQEMAARLNTHQQCERRLDVVELVDVAFALGLNASDLVEGVTQRG